MKIYELLSDPKNWTRGAYARDAGDRPVYPDSPEACKWCLLGAVEKCYPNLQLLVCDKLISAMGKPDNHQSLVFLNDFNDYGTHSAVLELARKADV